MHLAAIVVNLLAFLALFLAPLWANVIFVSILLAGIIIVFRLDFREPI